MTDPAEINKRDFVGLPALEAWLVEQQPRVAGGGADARAFVLAEFHHCVVLARVEAAGVEWSPEAPVLAPEYLVDLRLFGLLGEVRLWRADDGTFDERSRIDAPEHTEHIDDTHALWGSDAKKLAGSPGWSVMTEDRGIRYCLPLAITGERKGNTVPRFKLRQYVARDETTGLAYIEDWRLVDLLPGGTK